MKYRPMVLTIAATVVFAACSGAAPTIAATPAATPGTTMMSTMPSMAPSGSMAAGAPMTDSADADLRTKLDLALGEHIIFAANATEAALGGRADDFAANDDLLNKNGTDLGAMIGSVYGTHARDQFNKIWSAHNGFFVDYTTGVAKKDKAMQDKAVQT